MLVRSCGKLERVVRRSEDRRTATEIRLADRSPPARSIGWLEVHGRLLATLVGLELVGDALVLVQRRHAGALNRGDVHECIVAAAIRRDEAIALVGVENLTVPVIAMKWLLLSRE